MCVCVCVCVCLTQRELSFLFEARQYKTEIICEEEKAKDLRQLGLAETTGSTDIHSLLS